MACGLVACTAANPAFDTGDAVDGSGPSTTSTTSVTPTTTSTTEVGPTGDTSTTRATTEGGSSTTDGPPRPPDPRPCCDADECDDDVRQCVCDLNESCCQNAWSLECEQLAVACNGVCDGNLRPCCVPHGQPACTGVLLQNFCLLNGTCCGTAWTAECVVAYDEAYGFCGLGPCAVVGSSPGCDNAAVMDCVCVQANKPQCCTEAWGPECAEASMAC